MSRLDGIDRLPPADQVTAYLNLAAHFRSMAALAHTDAVKMTFLDMAKNMDDHAKAVTVFVR
jgi:hypothetical protein